MSLDLNLERQSAELKRLVQRIHSLSPHASFEFVDVTFGDTANSDVEVATVLRPPNPEGIDYYVVRADRPCSIYNDHSVDRRPWGRGYITVRCDVAGATVRLLLIEKKPGQAIGDSATSQLLLPITEEPLTGEPVLTSGASTDNAIVRWDGVTGRKIQNSGITIADGASGSLSGTNTGDQNTFSTIAVSGQSDVVADAAADTLTLAAGSGITITTNASTDTVTIAASGGGGGDSTETTAIGSESLTGTGDLNLYTNAPYVGRYNGSTWDPWGPIFDLTKPSDTGFAWVNQGSSSLTTSNGALTLIGAATGAGANIVLRVKTAPATPYTITAYLDAVMLTKAYQSYGLAFRESGTGRLHMFDIVGDATVRYLRSTKFTSATAFSADYQIVRCYEPIKWFRIADNGSNRICSISPDGQSWLQIHSIGRTDFLTADQVGFYVGTENSTTPNLAPILNVVSWKEA